MAQIWQNKSWGFLLKPHSQTKGGYISSTDNSPREPWQLLPEEKLIKIDLISHNPSNMTFSIL